MFLFQEYSMSRKMLNIDRELICRACLTTNSNEMLSFLTNNLAELYESLTSLKIEIDDVFPSVICQKCKENLEYFHDFKMICIRSYKELESRLKLKELKIECNLICDVDLQVEKENNENDGNIALPVQCKIEIMDVS